jgi:hypothetical protein
MLPKPNGNGTNHLFALNSLRNNDCATALRNVQGMARLAQASRRDVCLWAIAASALRADSAPDSTCSIRSAPADPQTRVRLAAVRPMERRRF